MRMNATHRRTALIVLATLCILLPQPGCRQIPDGTETPRGTTRSPWRQLDIRVLQESPTELRGMFVATAYNIDWPSQRGLPKLVQLNEIDAIISRAKELNCNAIFLQVRAFGDRMHGNSTVQPQPEPWALALNDTADPGYDPLAEWHRRCRNQGMLLFAWINPFRTDFVIKVNGQALPSWPSSDGNHLYLDPTHQGVQDYLIEQVIRDLLHYRAPRSEAIKMMMQPPQQTATTNATQPNRDDEDGIDGIVVDHNIPDPENPGGIVMGSSEGAQLASAKPATAKKLNTRIDYLLRHNKLVDQNGNLKPPAGQTNVDAFIKRAYEACEGRRRLFALSPGGGRFDEATGQMFAGWLKNGWCHYIIPELYHRDFNTFKEEWQKWKAANTGEGERPHLVPALNTIALEWAEKPDELWTPGVIEEQIDFLRNEGVGQVHFSARSLRRHDPNVRPHNVGEKWKAQKYRRRPLLPRAKPPAGALPKPTITEDGDLVKWEISGHTVHQWEVTFKRRFGRWGEPEVLPSHVQEMEKPGGMGRVRVQAVDRHGRKRQEEKDL